MALNKSPYRGTRDFFPAQMRLRNFIFQKMAEVSEKFSYEPYDGPILEEVDLYLAKSGEELINEQIYSFIDRGDRKVAIRPEMTPTVARMAAQVHREIPKPFRWYAIPNLMRYEKPQKGRLREFWQYNADIFGAPAVLGEIEMIQLAVEIMKSFGATAEQFEIQLNDRRVVDAFFKEVLKLDDEAKSKLYKVVDKVTKVDAEALKKMTTAIITDAAKAEIFYGYLKLDTFDALRSFLATHGLNEVTSEFIQFMHKLEGLGLDAFVIFDPTIVRGLDYYTGIVFEIFDKHPDNRRAIAGGGAYANLLQIFNEPALAGVGFGLGEVTLTDFLTTHNLLPDFSKAETDVLIAYLTPDAEKACFLLAERMRERGVKTEIVFGEAKPKKVFTQTEKKNYKAVAFIGEDELKNEVVQVKNLATRISENIPLVDFDRIARTIKGL